MTLRATSVARAGKKGQNDTRTFAGARWARSSLPQGQKGSEGIYEVQTNGQESPHNNRARFYSESLPELSDPELESDECSLSLPRRTGIDGAPPPFSNSAMRCSS